VRTIPGVSHSAVVAKVSSLAEAAGAPDEVRSSVEVVDDRPPVDTPSSHPLVGALAAAHSSVYGSAAVYGGVPGATDGTILTRDAGMVTIVYGPGGKWIAHQADEFVEVNEIVKCTRVFAETARLFLGG
jgi:succinyl-diaminopimelate desuccinylase